MNQFFAERFNISVAFLVQRGAAVVPHSRSVLLHHLLGTYQLLLDWGASEDVCLAGLNHSIYGTDSFAPALVSCSENGRHLVAETIGSRAENLVWAYHCRESEPAATLSQFQPDLLNLVVANEVEQAHRASIGHSAALVELSDSAIRRLLPGARLYIERSRKS